MTGMRLTVVIILICVFCAFSASALVPDDPQTQVTTNKRWIVANHSDLAKITLEAYNQSIPI